MRKGKSTQSENHNSISVQLIDYNRVSELGISITFLRNYPTRKHNHTSFGGGGAELDFAISILYYRL